MTDFTGKSEVIEVSLGERSYEVRVGSGLLEHIGQILSPMLVKSKVAILTDETVSELYLPTLISSLEAAGIQNDSFVVTPGEATKDMVTLENLLEWLLETGIERSDAVLVLGGGVVGDLGGFAASILRRGVNLIHLPTTLLAQVDSSIGGKVAINARQGKNLIGNFHQPMFVGCDVSVLDTLPKRELVAGYAEIVKYGLLADSKFFDWLEAYGNEVLQGDVNIRSEAIIRSCRVKAGIVSLDEREHGDRKLLNLGHTFAHALEVEAGYGMSLLHGEAVAIGLRMAFDLSARLGFCTAGDAFRVRNHLHGMGLPTGLQMVRPEAWSAKRILKHMYQDKKVKGGKVVFVLARGVGRTFISHDVDEGDVLAVLEEAAAD